MYTIYLTVVSTITENISVVDLVFGNGLEKKMGLYSHTFSFPNIVRDNIKQVKKKVFLMSRSFLIQLNY